MPYWWMLTHMDNFTLCINIFTEQGSREFVFSNGKCSITFFTVLSSLSIYVDVADGWLVRAVTFQWHESYCHDLEVISLDPNWIKLSGVKYFCPKSYLNQNVFFLVMRAVLNYKVIYDIHILMCKFFKSTLSTSYLSLLICLHCWQNTNL